MLGQGFDKSDAERPDVARRGDDAPGDFRRIVRARMPGARGGGALLRFGGRRLLGVFGKGGNSVVRELELIRCA